MWNAGAVTSSGNISANGNINITAATTETRALQIGANRADNGFSILDLIGDTTYADYGLRIQRANTGADSSSSVVHRGTGPLYISTVEAGIIGLRTSNTTRFVIGELGQFGIGGSTYGTSGQVLTSGGSGAAPSWASVGTATSGLAYGDVGSYGWFYYAGLGSNNPGALLSGANLYPANSYQSGTSAGYYTGLGAVGGTWRLMGETGRYNGTTVLSRADMSVSLFLRVS